MAMPRLERRKDCPMLRLRITGLIVLLALVAPPSLALAASSRRSPAHPPRSHDSQNRKDLQAFLNRIIRSKMATYHAPGFGISVVQNGKILLSKGYGYADLQRRVPVSPDRTIWRMASVAVP